MIAGYDCDCDCDRGLSPSRASDSASSSSAGPLEDPNIKRTQREYNLIEELETDPPAAGLYMWSCGHKIHWDCWKRLRGGPAQQYHCPYCNS